MNNEIPEGSGLSAVVSQDSFLTGRERSTQCEIFVKSRDGGRCSRGGGRTEEHHILGRPRTPTTFLCTYHHQCVEQRQVERESWLYRVQIPTEDGGFNYAYSRQKDGEPTHFLWPNVEEDLTVRAEELFHEAQIGVDMRHRSAWILLDSLHSMSEEGRLWRLTPFESLAGIANEVGISVPALNKYFRIGRQIHSLPPEQQERVRAHPPSLWDKAKMAVLPAEDLEEVLDGLELPAKDLNGVVEDSRQRAQKATAAEVGAVTTEVILLARATTFRVTVSHRPEEGPLEAAKRKIFSSPLVDGVEFYPDGSHTITPI